MIKFTEVPPFAKQKKGKRKKKEENVYDIA